MAQAKQGCVVVAAAYVGCALVTVTLGVVGLSLGGVESFVWSASVLAGCLMAAVWPWVRVVDWLAIRDIQTRCLAWNRKLVRIEPAPGHYLVTYTDAGQEKTARWEDILEERGG